MSSLWQKTLMYLGLVDEEQLDEEIEARPPAATRSTRPPTNRQPTRSQSLGRDTVAGRRVEPPTGVGSRPVVVAADQSGLSAPSGSVRPVRPTEVQSDVVRVTDFGDAKVLADRIRERTPVVLDLRSTDPDMVRRIIDFASGLTYALDGTMAKTADGVVLVLPPRVTLGQDEQRRLQGQGLYELPESVS
jgi:cell division inhibitor SepF